MTNTRTLHKELVFEGKEVLYDAPQLYIDVDVEADGKAGYGSLLSIGAVALEGEQFYIELKPLNDEYIPSQRQFCEEHGLERKRLLQEGVDPHKAIQHFVNWTDSLKQIYKKPVVFSAFNAGWDYGLIDLYIHTMGFKNPFMVAPFDIKSATQNLAGDWDWRQTSKDNLPEILLPHGDFTHNALEDAVYQQEIHFALAGLIKRRNS